MKTTIPNQPEGQNPQDEFLEVFPTHRQAKKPGSVLKSEVKRMTVKRKDGSELVLYEQIKKTVLGSDGITPQEVDEEKACCLDDNTMYSPGMEIDTCTNGHFVPKDSIIECPKCTRKMCRTEDCFYLSSMNMKICPFCDTRF